MKREVPEEQKNWFLEFKDFLETKQVPVPRNLTQKILEAIHKRLNPDVISVFFRLALIHAGISILTILLCPQFGLQIFSGFGGLTALFMKWGINFCMFACGVFFMSVGILAAVKFLPPEHIKIIKKHHLIFPIILTFLSEVFLVSLGKGVVFSWIVFWLLGGILGSLVSTEIGVWFRFHKVRYTV